MESQEGKGSKFSFTTRFGRQENAEAARAPSDRLELEGMRVLVVDDNATNRRSTFEEILVNWMMVPTVVAGGASALSELQRAAEEGEPYALILLDAQMPEMDGFEMAEMVRRKPALAGATILMLTSAGEYGDIARARELGVASYLVKPVKQADLMDAVVKALGSVARDSGPAATKPAAEKAERGLEHAVGGRQRR